MTFSWNLLADLDEMLRYPFMVHAFEAGTIIAFVAGLVSYLVVLRRSSFAAHAMAHVGFAGGAGAVLAGINPIFGLFAFTTVTGSGIAVLGPKASQRDVEIGSVLAFMLGIGLLFISLYHGFGNETYSFLFGEPLGIGAGAVVLTFLASLLVLGVIALVYRPLLFASLDEEVAEAKGMPMLGLGVVFMLLVAAAVSIAVQVVGILLIFALMVTPAAIAVRLSKRPVGAIGISIAVALLGTWAGLFLSWYLPYPVSFFITTLIFGTYVTVRGVGWVRTRWRQGRSFPPPVAI
ncbi:MAG TPA: metal ABC transporter permease [Thermoplasmata archaeon]|nr:metal ABC transporter permease [Thermoplasmata archaeon]HEV2429074.1 metal ABC transporter permease [Thermoplasmata archaeon]